MFWLTTAGLTAVVAGGCGSSGGSASGSGYVKKTPTKLASATVPAGQEGSYFPFGVGNQWIFESTMTRVVNGRPEPPVKQQITYQITRVTPAPGGAGTDAWFTVLDGTTLIDRQVWRLNKSGLSQVSLGKKLHPFSSAQIVLPIPVKVDATFKWKGSVKADNGETRGGTNEGRVVGEEPIDTGMGTYNAMAVESKGTLNSPNSTSKIASKLWLVPNVGIGRYMQEAAGEVRATDPKLKGRKVTFGVMQVMKLKSFSFKK